MRQSPPQPARIASCLRKLSAAAQSQVSAVLIPLLLDSDRLLTKTPRREFEPSPPRVAHVFGKLVRVWEPALSHLSTHLATADFANLLMLGIVQRLAEEGAQRTLFEPCFTPLSVSAGDSAASGKQLTQQWRLHMLSAWFQLLLSLRPLPATSSASSNGAAAMNTNDDAADEKESSSFVSLSSAKRKSKQPTDDTTADENAFGPIRIVPQVVELCLQHFSEWYACSSTSRNQWR